MRRAEFRGVGIRIEDDVLITVPGQPAEVLTAIPKEMEEVEMACGGQLVPL